jgi:hypothetical protein
LKFPPEVRTSSEYPKSPPKFANLSFLLGTLF